MALKVIYEGIPAGELNLDATCLSTAANAIYAGMLCQLSSSGDVLAGSDATAAPVGLRGNLVYGIVADDKDDIIASGKITVYVTPGKYASDQLTTLAMALNEGDEITIGVGAGDNCLIDASTTGAYAYGHVTKAYTTANPWMEFMFTGPFVSL